MKYISGASFSNVESERELKNKRIAYEAALEGIVLLKNDGVLPLKSKKIALYGTGAICTIKGGTGSGEVNERHSVSILEGLEKAGFEVLTKPYLYDILNEYNENKHQYEEDFKKLSLPEMINSMNLLGSVSLPYGRILNEKDFSFQTDTAIYVVARQAGEGQDKKIEKGEFDLSPIEKTNIRLLSERYKNVILVINSGSYMNIDIVDEVDVKGIIFFCQQGSQGGEAFASIISGEVSPSGKLVDTWVKKYSDIPFADDYSYRSGDTSQEYYKEGIYVGYRYFDSFKVEPRYHFGYGLTYSKFSFSDYRIKVQEDNVFVSIKVRNVGLFSAKEVIQVYVSCPQTKIKKEYQRLVGFRKTKLLKPNEEEIIEISFDMDYCTSYHADISSQVLEEGDYIVRVGNASNETTIAGIIEIENDIIVSKLKNVCPVSKEFEILEQSEKIIYEDISSYEKIKYKRRKEKEIIKYKERTIVDDPSVTEILSKLSIKEMVDLCVGTGMPGMFNVNYVACPGACGRTTDKLIKKGLINVNLCDGPAGIRILKRCAISKRGIFKLKLIDYMMSFMEFFPKYIKRILGPSKKDKVLYQFTTAFPVGTSLAQTWNKELVEKVGVAIGDEMVEFNATYWLAPAMNIHRNPLCGRNYEYFSEDPVLSGKIASYLTIGIQSHEGIYSTIKHFACNNQEDNRNKCSSNIDERTLREIYLRGFEICVKEAHPKALMTSYNLVNGIYTPNSFDLINEVLRCEWKFDGLVMSDWYATGKEDSTNTQLGFDDIAIAVGNDLIMPGGRKYKKNILRGYKNGYVTKEQIQASASIIIKQILDSKVNKLYPPQFFLKNK